VLHASKRRERPQTASSVAARPKNVVGYGPPESAGGGKGAGSARNASRGEHRVSEELFRLLQERALVNGGWGKAGAGGNKGQSAGRGGGGGGVKASWDGKVDLGGKAGGTGANPKQEDLCISGGAEGKDLGAALGGSHFPSTFLMPAAPTAHHTPAHIKKLSQLRNIYQQANPAGVKPSTARAASLRPRSATARVESRQVSGGGAGAALHGRDAVLHVGKRLRSSSHSKRGGVGEEGGAAALDGGAVREAERSDCRRVLGGADVGAGVEGRGVGGKRTSITDLIARFRNAADLLDTEDMGAPAADGAQEGGRAVGGEDAGGAGDVQQAHNVFVAEELASRRFVVEGSEARNVLRRPQSATERQGGRARRSVGSSVELGGVPGGAVARERDSWAQSRATVDDLGSVLARVAVGGGGVGGSGARKAEVVEEEDLLEKWRSERKARLENNTSSTAPASASVSSSSAVPQQDAVGRIKRRLAGAAGISVGGGRDPAASSADGARIAGIAGIAGISGTGDGSSNCEAISRIRRRLAGAGGGGAGGSGAGYAERMRERVTGKAGEEGEVEEDSQDKSADGMGDEMGDEELGILRDEDDGPSSDDELHLPVSAARYAREDCSAACEEDSVPILSVAPSRSRYGGGGSKGGGGGGGLLAASTAAAAMAEGKTATAGTAPFRAEPETGPEIGIAERVRGQDGAVVGTASTPSSPDAARGGDTGAARAARAAMGLAKRADREMLCVRALSGREEEDEDEEDKGTNDNAADNSAATGGGTSHPDGSHFARPAQGDGGGRRADYKPPKSPEHGERDVSPGLIACLSDEIGDSIARLLFGLEGAEGLCRGELESQRGGGGGGGGSCCWGDAALTNFEVA